MNQTAYFFGTFNPVHQGHLLMAEFARTQFYFDHIWFIPAFVPPHRQNDPEMADFAHRYRMVKLACGSNPHFRVSPIESQREAPSYTIETLRALVPDFERTAERLPCIIGTDALLELGTWHQAERLAQNVLFLQAARGDKPMVDAIQINGTTIALATQRIAMPAVDISSTLVRQRLRQGLSIRYLTPQSVVDYIAWNGLYKPDCIL